MSYVRNTLHRCSVWARSVRSGHYDAWCLSCARPFCFRCKTHHSHVLSVCLWMLLIGLVISRMTIFTHIVQN